jgi:V/A-type H+-transporting ATPase subunit E
LTGLEKIIKEIKDEAAGEVSSAISAAEAEAEVIIAAAKEESGKIVADIERAALWDIADVKRSEESAIALQRRQRTLQVKQAIIKDVIDSAKLSLYELPLDEYFDLLIRLAVSSAVSGKGELFLGEKDLARLPRDFEEKLNRALGGGKALAVSGNPKAIDGGVVLVYGGVEENCSFDAVFDMRRDDFSDLIRDTLFA